MYNEAEDEQLDQAAVLALLMGQQGPVASQPPATPEQLEQAALLAALQRDASRVPSSRSILDRIDPMHGPTRAREVKRTVEDHVRSLLASAPPRQTVTPSGATIQLPPQANMFGAGTPFPAMASGIVSKLLDNPTDLKGAVIEGMGRGAVAPYQDDVPTVSGELQQRGYDPGAVGRFVVDAVTDPSNLLGGGGVAGGIKKVAGKGVVDAAEAAAPNMLRRAAAALTDGADDMIEEAGEDLVKGSAGWFPPQLKTYLDDIASKMRDEQRAVWIAAGKDPKKFGPQVSEIQTKIKNIIRNDISKGDSREAQRLIDGYFTTALPSNYRGVDFDTRRPVAELLTPDSTGGVQFDDTSKQRLALAFEQGSKRAEKEQWGDNRWLYHLSNGDPKVAAQITRLLGAFSPGQKTDANTLNAIEAFLRYTRGESVDDILGHKVPDPARPGKMMRQGATLSTGHPRPGTVEDNLQRAMQGGRIFDAKVEALAGAELGLHDDIPIDLWLMRAIGASSDSTPSAGAYRLISEAMAKEAAAKNENPFTYMAKVWMGMQDIVGTPTPSFAESAAHVRLPANLKTPGVGEEVLGNMAYHGAGVKDRTLPGARSAIATNPDMPYPEWEREAKDLFLRGKQSDVLGKKTIVKNPAPITLEDFQAKARDTERLENMMRGYSPDGAVFVNMPLEAAPGANSGVSPSYGLSTQVEQDKRDKSLLQTLLDDSGKVGVAEALFPGRTAPPIAGQGEWPTPQGVQRNLLSTIPIEMGTTANGRRLDPEDMRRAMTLSKYLGIAFGQDAVPTTAVQFGPAAGRGNVVRVWPSAGENMPRANQVISAQLPAGDWVIQHRDTGVDLFRPGGETLSQQEKKILRDAAQGVMTPEGQRGAGARVGRNIAGKASYVQPAWGAEGSRQATTDFLKTWRGLSSANKDALDAAAKPNAAQLYRRVKRDKNTSPAHLNFLKIVASDGVSGLLKALKDNPNLAVPVLAMLGVGSTLVPRQNESPDEQ